MEERRKSPVSKGSIVLLRGNRGARRTCKSSVCIKASQQGYIVVSVKQRLAVCQEKNRARVARTGIGCQGPVENIVNEWPQGFKLSTEIKAAGVSGADTTGQQERDQISKISLRIRNKFKVRETDI